MSKIITAADRKAMDAAQEEASVSNNPVASTKLNRQKKFELDHKMVRGIFRFFEAPGCKMTFSVKPYKEDDVLDYTLQDGEVYELPYMVAKHLNTNCSYPIHEYQQDESGRHVQKIGRIVQRCGFQSTEFTGVDDPVLQADTHRILTAEMVR